MDKTRVVINLNKAAHEIRVREAKKLGISQSLLCEIALKKLVNNPVSIGL